MSKYTALLKNPATRAAVKTKFLTPKQQKQRALNTALDAPIVSGGSGITRRQVAKQREAYITTKYGASDAALKTNVTTAANQQKDTGQWYDAYLKDLAAHRANVQQTGVDANAQIAGLGQGIQSLANVDNQAQATAMAKDAASRGATVNPDVAGTNDKAAMIRQALVASFGGALAGQNAASTNYADNLAHVVGPGQKLTALNVAAAAIDKAKQKITDQAAVKGADRSAFQANIVNSELKAVTAAQLLGQKTASAKSVATIKAKAQTNSPAAQKTKAQNDYFAKHGYYPPTGPPKSAKSKAPKVKSKYSANSVQTSAWQKIEQAAAIIRQHPAMTFKQVDDGSAPVSGAQLRAAFEIARTGRLTHSTAAGLHTDGIQLKGRYKTFQPKPIVNIPYPTARLK